MSIFGNILSKIFSHAEAAPANPSAQPQTSGSAAPASPTPSSGAAPTAGSGTTATAPNAAPGTSGGSPSSSGAAQSGAAGGTVDVAAVLDGLAAKSQQRLDWKHSIVDMMKLLDLDSSLEARKTLAQELHYSGDTGDSAAMNIWLHKQVMQKLAENGGKVPADLRA